jgi:hypothetical protein
MTTYPKLIDFAGWALGILAVLIAFVAILGAVAVLFSASPWGISRIQERLHETHYVIYPHWGMAFVFLICIALASGIGYLGYSQTQRSVERRIANVEPAGPPNSRRAFPFRTRRVYRSPDSQPAPRFLRLSVTSSFGEEDMRTVGVIASLAARHAFAAGAVFVVGCVFWTLAYFGLLIWASVTGGGMGSPAVYPIGLLLLLAGTVAVSLLFFLPATVGGEALCRSRSWPTLVGIPVTFALFCILAFLWSAAAHLLHAFEERQFWSLALAIILTMVVPLGLYWWAAEFPHLVWDIVRAFRLSRHKQNKSTEPASGANALPGEHRG